jgi:serine/threonine protein kinase/GTPase SAR1 family protein
MTRIAINVVLHGEQALAWFDRMSKSTNATIKWRHKSVRVSLSAREDETAFSEHVVHVVVSESRRQVDDLLLKSVTSPQNYVVLFKGNGVGSLRGCQSQLDYCWSVQRADVSVLQAANGKEEEEEGDDRRIVDAICRQALWDRVAGVVDADEWLFRRLFEIDGCQERMLLDALGAQGGSRSARRRVRQLKRSFSSSAAIMSSSSAAAAAEPCSFATHAKRRRSDSSSKRARSSSLNAVGKKGGRKGNADDDDDVDTEASSMTDEQRTERRIEWAVLLSSAKFVLAASDAPTRQVRATWLWLYAAPLSLAALWQYVRVKLGVDNPMIALAGEAQLDVDDALERGVLLTSGDLMLRLGAVKLRGDTARWPRSLPLGMQSSALRWLDVSSMRIGDAQLAELPLFALLDNLAHLDLSDNALTRWPTALPTRQLCWLSLARNPIELHNSRLLPPAHQLRCKRLQYLDLSATALANVPLDLVDMGSGLATCPFGALLDVVLDGCPFNKFEAYNCSLRGSKTTGEWRALINEHLHDLLDDNGIVTNRVKVLIVGDAAVGKTVLLRWLSRGPRGESVAGSGTTMSGALDRGASSSALGVVGGASSPSRTPITTTVSTDGVEHCEFALDADGVAYTAAESLVESCLYRPAATRTRLIFRAADFAGQRVYYATHTFFMTSESLYLLCWDVRQRDADAVASLSFWLQSVRARAPDSPVVLIATHIDHIKQKQERVAALRRVAATLEPVFGANIARVIGVSGRTGENMKELRQLVYATAEKRLFSLPSFFVRLEQAIDTAVEARLGQAKPPVMTRAEFAKHVLEYSRDEQLESVDATRVHRAIEAFRSLGKIVASDASQRFPPLASDDDLIVLSPDWLARCFASVLTTSHRFGASNGFLRSADLKQIWKRYDAELHEQLLSLLASFDVLFPFPAAKGDDDVAGDRQILVPTLLPDALDSDTLVDLWPSIDDMHEIDACARDVLVEYERHVRFDFVPPGLLSMLFVRLLRVGELVAAWRSGIVIDIESRRIVKAKRRHRQATTAALTSTSDSGKRDHLMHHVRVRLDLERCARHEPGTATPTTKSMTIGSDLRVRVLGRSSGLSCPGSDVGALLRTRRRSVTAESAFGFVLNVVLSLCREWFHVSTSMLTPCPHCKLLVDKGAQQNVFLFSQAELEAATARGQPLIHCALDPLVTLRVSALAPELSLAESGLAPIDVDRIELLGKLGHGSFGLVHRALLRADADAAADGIYVAVKEFVLRQSHHSSSLSASSSSDTPDDVSSSSSSSTATISPKAFQELQHEAWLMSSLDHRNIVRLHGYVLDPPALVLELMEGGTLYALLHDPASLRDAAQTLCVQVKRAQQPQRSVAIRFDDAFARELDALSGALARVERVDHELHVELSALVETLAAAARALFDRAGEAGVRTREDALRKARGALDHVYTRAIEDRDAIVRMSWPLRLRVALDVARGCHFLHTSVDPPIVLRDLKSPNLLLSVDVLSVPESERPASLLTKIADFGLSARAGGRLRADRKLQQMNPSWQSGEVLSGAIYSRKADVYAFGVTLFELLTRQMPFRHLPSTRGLTGFVLYDAIRDAIVRGERPEIAVADESAVPPAYVALIERCWHADMVKRPDFAEILSELEQLARSMCTPQELRALGISMVGDDNDDNGDGDDRQQGERREQTSSAASPSSLLPVDDDLAGIELARIDLPLDAQRSVRVATQDSGYRWLFVGCDTGALLAVQVGTGAIVARTAWQGLGFADLLPCTRHARHVWSCSRHGHLAVWRLGVDASLSAAAASSSASASQPPLSSIAADHSVVRGTLVKGSDRKAFGMRRWRRAECVLDSGTLSWGQSSRHTVRTLDLDPARYRVTIEAFDERLEFVVHAHPVDDTSALRHLYFRALSAHDMVQWLGALHATIERLGNADATRYAIDQRAFLASASTRLHLFEWPHQVDAADLLSEAGSATIDRASGGGLIIQRWLAHRVVDETQDDDDDDDEEKEPREEGDDVDEPCRYAIRCSHRWCVDVGVRIDGIVDVVQRGSILWVAGSHSIVAMSLCSDAASAPRVLASGTPSGKGAGAADMRIVNMLGLTSSRVCTAHMGAERIGNWQLVAAGGGGKHRLDFTFIGEPTLGEPPVTGLVASGMHASLSPSSLAHLWACGPSAPLQQLADDGTWQPVAPPPPSSLSAIKYTPGIPGLFHPRLICASQMHLHVYK